MKVKVGDEEVDLDPKVFRFTEATLSEYLMKDASLLSYYGAKWADAAFIHATYEDRYEQAFSRKMREYKETGATDKLADAMAKSDPEVVEIKEQIRNAKRIKDLLSNHMKALEKNHENALNLGYNIRKELDVHNKSAVKSLDDILN
jgi:hypothetical protein